MTINLQNYFTFEMIYLWTNFGVMPFWLILIFLPNSKLNQILVNSILIPLILAASYAYVVYLILLSENSLLSFFNLYSSLDELYSLFSEEYFLLIFWLHFLSLNLFLGSWVSRDGVKYMIPKNLVAVPLILIYFCGPIGLVFYWLIRIFYSKKIGFHD